MLETLAYSSKVTVVCAEKETKMPDGCAIVTVSEKVTAHLLLKGIIDGGKEIEKLEKKKSQLQSQHSKLTKATQIDGYESKVPEDIRLANAEKCKQTEKELDRIADAIKALQLI